jgi:hypothetical protein
MLKSSHVFIPNQLFQPYFPTEILYEYLISPLRATSNVTGFEMLRVLPGRRMM